MLAFPGGDTFETALLGRPPWQSYMRVMGGALILQPHQQDEAGLSRDELLSGIRTRLLARLSLMIALLLVAPRLRVSTPPGIVSRIAEVLLPGSGRPWLRFGGVLSGVTMVAWFGLFFMATVGVSPTDDLHFFGFRIPLHIVLKVVAVFLFAVNLFLVIRSWKRPSPANQAP
jgi:hypothetical protein